jgi:hypothetical protein
MLSLKNYLSISLQETFNYIFTSYTSGQEQYSPSESPSVSNLEKVSETKLVYLQGDTRMTDLFHSLFTQFLSELIVNQPIHPSSELFLEKN